MGSSLRMPTSAPGTPTFVSPVRIGDCPVMKAARPAVQLCCPYQLMNIGALFADAVDVRRLEAQHAAVVDAGVPPADVVAHDHQDVGLLGLRGRGHGRQRQGHETTAPVVTARTPACMQFSFVEIVGLSVVADRQTVYWTLVQYAAFAV